MFGNHLPILLDLSDGVKSGSRQLKQWKSEQVKENVTPKRKSSSPAVNSGAKRIRQVKDTSAPDNDADSPALNDNRKDHVTSYQEASYKHSNPNHGKQVHVILSCRLGCLGLQNLWHLPIVHPTRFVTTVSIFYQK